MPKPLENKREFREILNQHELAIVKRLAEIEEEDADRCANCGGEDCICCEYYHDRQKWVSYDELFEDDSRWY